MAAELAKRKARPDILADAFPAQRACISSTARRRVVLCTRRAGKSYGVGLLICAVALAFPGCTITYLGMTVDTCKRIMFKDVLKPINDKHGIGARLVSGGNPEMRFPNGSVVYFVGVDTDEKQRNKLLGQKNKLVVIDEPQDMYIDIGDLILRVIGPSLIDQGGGIIMLGTASDNTGTQFYELTKTYQSTPGWEFWQWSALENPHVASQFAAEIAELKQTNPEIESTPSYQQHYLGRWAIDEKQRCYRHHLWNFDVKVLPKGEYLYVLAVDLGWSDETAFVLGAWSYTDRRLYIMVAYKKSGLDFTGVAEHINLYRQRWQLYRIMVDGSNRQGVEEMRQRHQLPLECTEKIGKTDFIELMNADLDAGLIKVLPEAAETLQDEWGKLIWDPKKKTPPRQEHPGLPNHASDAALYLWRKARNFLAAHPPPPKTPEEQYEEDVARAANATPYDALEREYGYS